MSIDSKSILPMIALAGLGAATGGFGLLGAGASGLGAGAGAAGAAGAAAPGALGAGALGMTTAAPGIAAAFGPGAGSLGASLLGSQAATPMLTEGLLGGSAPMIGFGTGGAEALAYDPRQFAGPFDRMQSFLGSDNFGRGMRGLDMANRMMPQQQPMPMQARPPQPAQQQQAAALQGDPNDRRRRQFPGYANYL